MSDKITLTDLNKLTNVINVKYGPNPYQFIDYCGLVLETPPQREYHSCTPKNAITFASTEGDGVHFSILQNNDQDVLDGPVIMTVPMALEEDINTVITEDLREFLNLGYHVGWFGLEQIVYQTPPDYGYFSKPDPDHEEDEKRFLEIVREVFETQPISFNAKRLEDLRIRYFNLLEIDLSDWG